MNRIAILVLFVASVLSRLACVASAADSWAEWPLGIQPQPMSVRGLLPGVTGFTMTSTGASGMSLNASTGQFGFANSTDYNSAAYSPSIGSTANFGINLSYSAPYTTNGSKYFEINVAFDAPLSSVTLHFRPFYDEFSYVVMGTGFDVSLVSGTAAAQYDSLTRSLTSLGTGTAGGSLLITTLVPGETLSSFSFQVHGTPYDSNYGQVPSTSHVFTLSTTVPVPEPASGLLTCLGATVFLMRRRRRQHCNQATRTKSPPSMLSAAA